MEFLVSLIFKQALTAKFINELKVFCEINLVAVIPLVGGQNGL
jgi:hypothetical protein